MLVQIEITTHCNYGCFYCAGRDMPQKHMAMHDFVTILDRLSPGIHHLSLQGEGEPTTHPQFWDMVQLARERGYVPYTITNGSRLDPELIGKYFSELGISIDTLDPDEAERIGRFKLSQMLTNLQRLLASYDPSKITVHTVDYGQDFESVKAFIHTHGIGGHVIQPLQVKDDYAYRYANRIPAASQEYSYRCRHIEQPTMRFYTITGIEMPCCFMKDANQFISTADIKETLARREVPAPCSGCGEIRRREGDGKTGRSGVIVKFTSTAKRAN